MRLHQNTSPQDCIFAFATAPVRAGVAVLRLSGMGAGNALRTLTSQAPLPSPRVAMLRKLSHPETGENIDQGLILWFPAPASYTGEEMVEIHCHGSPAVMRSLLAALGALPGMRHAEAGEFTYRAFLNGKLDLTQAEAVADLIDAETESQQRQALQGLEGRQGVFFEGLRQGLVVQLALLEALIDFPEEDIPPELMEQIYASIRTIETRIGQELDAVTRKGEAIRNGIGVAIVGPPNAGKSSLLNALAERDAAIVSEHAGTTRDVVEVMLNLRGLPVLLSDTAGIRDTVDPVEKEGVTRAARRGEEASIRLLVLDATEGPAAIVSGKAILNTLQKQTAPIALLWNKCDAAPAPAFPSDWESIPCFTVSVKAGDGLSDVLEWLGGRLEENYSLGAQPMITRARHRDALRVAHEALSRFHHHPAALELAGEELRHAARAIGSITGRVDVETVLGEIFSRFCIGK